MDQGLTHSHETNPDADVSAVVISYSDPEATVRAVQSLLGQSRPPRQVLVVDNDPVGALQALAERLRFPPHVRVLHPGKNLGYTRAANLAADSAAGEWLFFLNPDAHAETACLTSLLDAARDREIAIVGAQVLLPDGRTNAGENPVSLAGLSWSGRYAHPRECGPAREVAAVSGAALMVRRDAFVALGGMCPSFFMYYDDSDLAWRARIAGWRVVYCPEAAVIHDYVFQKRGDKWFYLERNRMWAVLSNYELRTLVLLLPLLAAVELVIVSRAAAEGWVWQKLLAWSSLIRNLPALVRWRRSVQVRRKVSDYEVLSLFRGGVETELLESALLRYANPWLERYRRLVLFLLGCQRSACSAISTRAGSGRKPQNHR